MGTWRSIGSRDIEDIEQLVYAVMHRAKNNYPMNKIPVDLEIGLDQALEMARALIKHLNDTCHPHEDVLNDE